jgi:hypothetical protein
MNKLKSKKKATAAELDAKHDRGEDISGHVDWANATKPIQLDLPAWVIKKLDQEADRRGIARQALIKGWIVDRLDALSEPDKKGA